ncbi:MAG: ykoV 2 [Acidobacteria bacterium]|nr:ykoV 2 [Acidobacteriota bacterium]
MAARSIWKGQIKIGTNKIPVKLYSAVTDRNVRFNILDGRHQRVKQHMVKQDGGEEVPAAEIKKAYELEPGKFVILTEEDLQTIEPEPSREISVTEFVPTDQIAQQYYERPYYLAPDGDEKNYFALAEALAKTEREGIADWVMRNKAYSGALRAQDGYLILATLRNADEVISAAKLPKPGGRAPSQKEISMARHLVSLLADEFNPEDYKDEYRDRVLEFIERKAKGHAPRLKLVKSKRKTTALDSALSKSIAAVKGRKEKRAA